MRSRSYLFVSVTSLVSCGGGGESVAPPPTPAAISASSGNGQTGPAGGTLPNPLQVRVTSTSGAGIEGTVVNFAAAANSGSVSATSVTTNADGFASTTWTLGTQVGIDLDTLRASVSGLGAPAVFTATVTAASASSISLVSGNSQSGSVGQPLPQPLVVVVKDQFGNPRSHVDVTWSVTAGEGSLTHPASTTGFDGRASVIWLVGNAGPNTAQATANNVAGSPVVFSATGVSSGTTIRGTVSLSNALLARFNASRRAGLASIPSLRVAKPGGRLIQNSNDPRNRARFRAAIHTPQFTPNDLIVTFKSSRVGAPASGSAALASRSASLAVRHSIRARMAPHLRSPSIILAGVSPAVLAARVRVTDPAAIEQVAAALSADPSIAAVERNQIMRLNTGIRTSTASKTPTRESNDPLYAWQAWHYGMIDLPEAWSMTTGSPAVLVAVLDDGIRFDHPGIAANLSSDGYDFVSNDQSVPFCSGGSIDNAGDGDGYDPDPTNPGDYDSDSDLGCLGQLSTSGNHGLHVAGTIGATGNDGVGVSGINWAVRIRPVRVLGTGSGSTYDVVQGLLYAAGYPVEDGAGHTIQAARGAQIINMSLGGAVDATLLRDAVNAVSDAGSLIIAAAGNAGVSAPHYPAAYPEVLSVSAVGPDMRLPSYSNFGSTIDIAAPGGDLEGGDASFGVISTTWDFTRGIPRYDRMQGTSMAAPHVAGVAALLVAQNPGMSAEEIRTRLTRYAVDAGPPGPDNFYGAGIVNARNSLAQNAGPPRQLRARLYNALTGGEVRTTPVDASGSYSFAGLTSGVYHVFAGQDENGDEGIGLPGRKWGAFGGSAKPSQIVVSGSAEETASFSIGRPIEQEPNGTLQSADLLPIGGYLVGIMVASDVDLTRVLVPQPGQYTFETSAVDGACGFALEEDTVLDLLDANGSPVASNDDIDANALNFCSRISATLAPSTYFLRVRGLIGGAYQIQARLGT